jgi:hypothetical protein
MRSDRGQAEEDDLRMSRQRRVDRRRCSVERNARKPVQLQAELEQALRRQLAKADPQSSVVVFVRAALIRSISSFMFLAGTVGLTATTWGDVATIVTGEKLLTGS